MQDTESNIPPSTPVGKNEVPRPFASKNARSLGRKIYFIIAAVLGLALFGFFIFLLAKFIMQHIIYDVKLKTISEARTFFELKKKENSLLVSANYESKYISLTFESTEPEVRLYRDIVSTFVLNQETWKAYLVFMDNTKQDIPYLGTSFEVSDSDVTLNPSGEVPLSAKINFQTPVPGKIKLTVAGKDAESYDLTHQFNLIATVHDVPVLGLYEDYNNVVTVTFTDPYGNPRVSKALNIQTGAPISNYFNMKIIEKSTYGKSLLMLIEGVVYDEQGYVRWYLLDATTRVTDFYAYPLSGGEFAYYKGAISVDQTIYIVNELGESLQTFPTTYQIHHDVYEKTPGGNLLIASAATDEDGIIEMDRKTGQIVKFWDLRDYFDETRALIQSNFYMNPIDWLHINSVEYDPKDNTILLSARNQCIFAKIGYDDGTVKYIAGFHDSWVAPYTQYLLTPTNFNTDKHKDQDWTFFQHNAQILPNGNVLVYDNGGMRPGFTNDPTTDIYAVTGMNYWLPYSTVPSGYARAVEYSVNYNAKTITKVWEHADFPNLMTTITGGVATVDGDYMLITYGEIGMATLVHKSTGRRLWRSQLGRGYYRTLPINLYAGY